MDNSDLRVQALGFALQYCPKYDPIECIVNVANVFHDFLIDAPSPKIEPETPLVSFFKRLRTIDPVQGNISLIPYRYQIDALEAMDAHPRVIINKARQIGGTMMAIVYAAWFASDHPNSTITVVTRNFSDARILRNRLVEMCELFTFRELNKHSVCFENGAQIRFTGAHTCSDISDSDLFIFDEAAFFSHRHGYQCWVAISKAITQRTGNIFGKQPDNVKIIMISTPYVTDGIFYDIWRNRALNGFYGIELSHKVKPSGIRPEDIGGEHFEQEFNCKFKEVKRTSLTGDDMTDNALRPWREINKDSE